MVIDKSVATTCLVLLFQLPKIQVMRDEQETIVPQVGSVVTTKVCIVFYNLKTKFITASFGSTKSGAY